MQNNKTTQLHVAVDMPWEASAHMGTGAYSEAMVCALAAVAPDWHLSLLVNGNSPRSIQLPNVTYHAVEQRGSYNEWTRQISVPCAISALRPDCLFAPATLLPLIKVCPTITTIHDVTFRTHPQYFSTELQRLLDYWVPLSIDGADHIITISDESREALRACFPTEAAKVTVIHQPIRASLTQPLGEHEQSRTLSDLGIKSPFLLHVSNLGPHKNTAFALEVFAAFVRTSQGASHQFVFAGGANSPAQPPDVLSMARQLGLANRVNCVGRIGDRELKALYQGCDVFLFPSLHEGWGLPVAEAAAVGARVIASPHVPAASDDQKIPFNVEAWVCALLDNRKGACGRPPVPPTTAGQMLRAVIERVVAEKMVATMPTKGTAAGANLITGCTIIRNGVRLAYPVEASIASYAELCSEVLICWDPTSEDDTRELVNKIKRLHPNVRLLESIWDLSNREGGHELRRQTQIAFDNVFTPWTLYIQADEALHECDHSLLRSLVTDDTIAGVSFNRRSFFRTLDQEIPEQRTTRLVRLFRTGYGKSIGDAMNCAVNAPGRQVIESNRWLFNYSRLGTEELIRLRSDNLNRFYHDDRYIEQLDPARNDHWVTTRFNQTHPRPMEIAYRAPSRHVTFHQPVLSSIDVVITVDDIRPEPNRGLEIDSGYVRTLVDLYREWGCRFTLFMPTCYHAAYDLRDHTDWFRTLTQLGCFEIACHGHHHWNLSTGKGEMEYMFETEADAVGCVAKSLAVFKDLGYRPRGVKAPGWGYSPHAISVATGTFDYLADHIRGQEWDDAVPQLPRLPYTWCIHEALESVSLTEGGLIVLHSHLTPEEGAHENGWTDQNRDNVRRFMNRVCSAGMPVRFYTAAEALDARQSKCV